MNELYIQCLIQYNGKGQSTVWIPESFAKNGKNIIVGKDKMTGVPAKVIRSFSTIKLTKEQIDINRKSIFDSIEERND